MNLVQKYFFILIIIILLFHKNLESLRIDDFVTNKIMKNDTFFKNIHPNIITISGLIMNFYIYYLLDTPNTNIYLLGFCIISMVSRFLDSS